MNGDTRGPRGTGGFRLSSVGVCVCVRVCVTYTAEVSLINNHNGFEVKTVVAVDKLQNHRCLQSSGVILYSNTAVLLIQSVLK